MVGGPRRLKTWGSPNGSTSRPPQVVRRYQALTRAVLSVSLWVPTAPGTSEIEKVRGQRHTPGDCAPTGNVTTVFRVIVWQPPFPLAVRWYQRAPPPRGGRRRRCQQKQSASARLIKVSHHGASHRLRRIHIAELLGTIAAMSHVLGEHVHTSTVHVRNVGVVTQVSFRNGEVFPPWRTHRSCK